MDPKLQHIMEDHEFRLAVFDIEEQDPWALVARVPPNERYSVWRGPNGDFHLGISSHVAGIVESGSSLAELEATLKYTTGLFWSPDAAALGLLAFVGRSFNSDRPSQESWKGFSGTEICIPKILFRRVGSEWKVLIFSMIDDMNDAYAEAIQVLGTSSTLNDPPLQDQSVLEVVGSSNYADWVQSALNRIQEDGLQKVVLARKQAFRGKNAFEVSEILRRLDARFPECFVFAHSPGQASFPVFLGASPERLAASKDGLLYTEALAGSAPRGTTEDHDQRLGEDLLSSEKDVREHEHVRSFIQARIMPISVRIDSTEIKLKRLSNVQHLHTEIVARLSDEHSILHAADLLHPTPAVAGTPTRQAMEFIQKTEDFDRGWYAGLFGWIAPEDNLAGEICVAIRSALIHGNKAELFAGAGIVEGSDPEREERETRVKMQALLEALT